MTTSNNIQIPTNKVRVLVLTRLTDIFIYNWLKIKLFGYFVAQVYGWLDLFKKKSIMYENILM